MKNKRKLYYAIAVILILSLATFCEEYIRHNQTDDIADTVEIVYVDKLPEDLLSDDTNLQMFFFDVGQADSTLIMDNGTVMLIDAGEDRNGKLLANYISELGISYIDYIIGTHDHADHIGGLDKIIDEFDIGEVYMPITSTENGSVEYKEVIESLKNKEKAIQKVEKGDSFEIGDATGIVMFVDNDEPKNVNNSSIIMQVTLDENNYLFMGDAEKAIENLGNSKNAEEKIEWTKVDVLKVGHHGSNTSSTQKFLNITSPQIAIISVGKGNRYRHPSESVINRLIKIGAEIYRTDELGTIHLENVNGENIINILKTNIQGVK